MSEHERGGALPALCLATVRQSQQPLLRRSGMALALRMSHPSFVHSTLTHERRKDGLSCSLCSLYTLQIDRPQASLRPTRHHWELSSIRLHSLVPAASPSPLT